MTAELRCAGRPVAHYALPGDLDPRLSPRPWLHPVRTLGGLVVSELMPPDHRHHLGVGVAVPDVGGRDFWGGRTFVAGRGPTELDNHGTQRHEEFTARSPGGFTERLSWRTAEGELLAERRTVAATRLGGTAWVLDLAFALTNTTSAALSLGSPATNGRPGAAYGGFFWRAPKEAAEPAVFTPAAEGEAAVHGRRADWLALAGDGWTLVFAGADERTRDDPWFVRTAQYPGVGSSLAHDRRLPLAPGATLVRRVVTVVADGRLDRERAGALARAAREAAGSVDPGEAGEPGGSAGLLGPVDPAGSADPAGAASVPAASGAAVPVPDTPVPGTAAAGRGARRRRGPGDLTQQEPTQRQEPTKESRS